MLVAQSNARGHCQLVIRTAQVLQGMGSGSVIMDCGGIVLEFSLSV